MNYYLYTKINIKYIKLQLFIKKNYSTEGKIVFKNEKR